MPVSPSTSVAGNSSNGSTVCVRHSSGGKGSFVTTLTRIHENIPVSDPGASGEHYTSAAFSDGAKEVSHVGGGSSSLPSTLPSSQPVAAAAADSGVQYPRSISTPSEGIGNQNPSHVHPMLQLVSKRARQFETGVLGEEEGPPNDRTSLYRSELSRLSSKRSVPNVAVRKREFESRSTSSGASGGARDGRRMNRDSRSLESADPPSSENQDERNEPVKLRARSNSAESWAAVAGSASRQEAVRNTLEWPRSRDDDHGDVANEPQRHKAVRQDSYLAAVRTPVTAERMARLLKRHGALPMDEHEEMDSLTPPVSPSTVPIPATPAERPNQLPIAHPLRPAEPQPVTSSPTCGVEDGDTNEAHDGIGKLVAALNDISPVPVSTIPSTVSSESSNVVTTASPDTSGVVRRQKNTTVSEEERLVRRVSYLKATWGDRMHVDSDLDLSDTESPRMQLRSSVIGTEPSTVETLRPECNKENLVREGWLHCKITLVDGK
ncbi:hypothetical protein B7P43_G03117, partial [Cryptotermes secundus]